jgi:hypothetical protein
MSRDELGHTNMTGAATAGRTAPAEHSATVEAMLRAVGAALQIVATWAVVRVLHPDAVGVYFRGFVIALGAAALLRAKYEIYMAHHIIGGRSVVTGVSDGVLLIQLGRRVLLRASLVCAALLVLATDIDIQAPRYEPVLETYLPFVLAIPGISLSTFIGEALRAANRTLFGTIIAAYAVNLSILIAVAFAPPNASLTLYAWAFFFGSMVSAALAVYLGRRALPAEWSAGAEPICRAALKEADERELIGVGRAALLFGPICILAVSASAIEMAQYAVAYRTAMIVDFFLPALNLSGARDHLRSSALTGRFSKSKLGRALAYSSLFVVVLLAAAPVTMRLYGPPYDSNLAVYALLLGMQWANGVGRPAVRHAVVQWDAPQIRAAVGAGAMAALIVCSAAVGAFGALAAAAATFIGAGVLNCWAIVNALSGADKRHNTS